MLNKRGQFFLLAALVISGILVGLATMYTTTQAPKEDSEVYDLSSELNYETAQVIDQGVVADTSQGDLNSRIVELANYYVNQNPGNNIIIVFGNETVITEREYTWVSGSIVAAGSGVTPQALLVNEKEFYPPIDVNTDATSWSITLDLGSNILQEVKIVKGQNFFSVIKKNVADQTYVASGGTGS